MEELREQLLSACRVYFKAQVQRLKVNVENYLSNSVAVAEHEDLIQSVEKELGLIAEYEDKLNALDKYFLSVRDEKQLLND